MYNKPYVADGLTNAGLASPKHFIIVPQPVRSRHELIKAPQNEPGGKKWEHDMLHSAFL